MLTTPQTTSSKQAELSALKQTLLQKRLQGKLKKKSTAAIPRHPRTGQPLPLSFAQQRLWFLEQFEGGHAAYNIPFGFRLMGALNPDTFAQCLSAIVRRHDALRTSFHTVDGQPVQQIAPKLDITLPVYDLGGWSTAEQTAEMQRLSLRDAQTPFDLAQCPLFRLLLFRVNTDEYLFFMTIHHIIYDGWSIGVFMAELSAVYQALLAHRPAPLPELAVQYADFAQWQRNWLQGGILEQQLAYWEKQLAGPLPVLDLPTDRPRPPAQTFAGATHAFTLPAGLVHDLRALCQQTQGTLFMLLLAAFDTLLFRYTGQEDIIIGSPIANRTRRELEPLIGFFVNLLALRTDLSGNPGFLELLARVRKMTLDAHHHQDLPFDELVAELQPARNFNRQAFFQVVFVLQNAPAQTLKFAGVTIEPVELHNGTAKFDLTLEMIAQAQIVTGNIVYNTDLFDAATIRRMAGHYQTLLQGIAANPEQRLSNLPILTETERRQILVEWNQTEAPYPLKCVHELFEAKVTQIPDAIALIFGEQQITYQELNQRANQLAHYLQKQEITPETLVGVYLERSIEMIIGMLGILKAGGAYIPLDPAYPEERILFMIEDSGMKILLTLQQLSTTLPAHQISVINLDTDFHRISQESEENLFSGVTPENLAYAIYTSGSTGKPKGVLIHHRGLLNLVFWHQRTFTVTSADRATQLAGMAFDASVWEIWPYLSIGARLYLVKPEILYSPIQLRDWFIAQEITLSFAPTPLAEELLSLKWPDHAPLRIMLTGGDQLHQYPPVSTPFKLVNNYGPTENTVVTTSWDVTCAETDKRVPPIGYPIANTQVYILDAYLQPVPIGVPGELYIGGVGLARGYLNRPDLTAEKFIPNPFSDAPGARLYKTGDLVRYFSDGNIEFLGRVDYQVKIRGFRIELGEIETMLNNHPAIKENVVVAREDTARQKRLVAYIVSSQTSPPMLNDLRSYLKTKLPDYMVPAVFLMLERLPLTPNGKIDRRALPDPDVESTETYVAPRTSAEKSLAEIWAALLDRKQVGIHDNFFDLGGHSLLTVQLLARINSQWQVNMTLPQFFQTPTIAGLLHQIGPASQSSKITAAETPRLDFHQEVVLDERIYPATTPDSKQRADPAAVFLTGATGFLGAFLLVELAAQTRAQIYCLARSADRQEAGARIRANLERYLLWQDALAARIVPVPGDLAQPCLGLADDQFADLARRLDVIYHNGALVNFAYPYALLKAANVAGTQEILRLACQGKGKPLHYISTVSVFDTVQYSQKEWIGEADPLDQPEGLRLGYNQSKWVAEKIVALAGLRGLPVNIYRPGRISGHSQTGAWNTSDFLCLLIKGCIQLGCIPEEYTQRVDLAPGDYVAKALVALSKQPAAGGQIFHLVNPQPMAWREFADVLCAFNYPLRKLPYDVWQTELMLQTAARENALAPLLPLFLEPGLPREPEHFSCRNTLAGLAGANIACPPVDAALLYTYLAYFLRSGFLRPPRSDGVKP